MQWVVKVIEGSDAGSAIKLAPGETLIGRGETARLRLASPTVSWEHAVITQSDGKMFLENLAATGTLVNGVRLQGRARLALQDKVTLSPDCTLRIEPVDGSKSSNTTIALLALVGVVVTAVAVIFSGSSDARQQRSWSHGYMMLDQWLEVQTANHQLPPEALDLFRSGWRLERASNPAMSARAWGRLNILLSSTSMKMDEQQKPLSAISGDYVDALTKIIALAAADDSRSGSSPPRSDAEFAAALVQFTRESVTYNLKAAKEHK